MLCGFRATHETLPEPRVSDCSNFCDIFAIVLSCQAPCLGDYNPRILLLSHPQAMQSLQKKENTG
jgi:hypothetical protein